MKGVSPIPDTDRIEVVEGADNWRIWRLRRYHIIKTTIPTTSTRPVTAPMIALTAASKRDGFDTALDVGSAVDGGGEVIVVLTCMFCTGTLCAKVVSHEKATYSRLTSEPTAQTLHPVPDFRATSVTTRSFDSVASYLAIPEMSEPLKLS